MLRTPLSLSILAGALAFGAASAVLALMGLGVPFLAGALGAAGAAALVLYAAARRAMAAPADLGERVAENGRISQDELVAAERAGRAATLRHDLRGALSPALMVADRLSTSQDPSARRAAQMVVRSIERATDLLAADKDETSPEAGPADPGQQPR